MTKWLYNILFLFLIFLLLGLKEACMPNDEAAVFVDDSTAEITTIAMDTTGDISPISTKCRNALCFG